MNWGIVFKSVIAFVKSLWSAAPVATTILALALMASLFFGVRSAVFWYDRPPLAERRQPVAAWMTPRYVARSWRVPRDLVLDAIDAPRPLPGGPVSLAQLADLRGVPVEQVIAELETAIAAFREDRGRSPAKSAAGSGQ